MFLRNYYVPATAKVEIRVITSEVKQAIRESGVQNGVLTVVIPGATAGVILLEGDPKIHEEYLKWVQAQIPESTGDRPNRRSGSGRNSAHLRAAMVGVQLTLPLASGKLMCGPWQEVVLLDFDDKAGRREITIQILGEGKPGT
jgi:secondary thiamine-phosphate synthase enzyme